MAVDGMAAARTLLTYRNIRGGLCLFYVWQAYDAHGADSPTTAGTALDAWNKSKGKHWGDRNPPPGVPVFFGAKPSSDAGDVVISLGGGRVAATDWPVYGVVGITTIDERQRQIGRPYLGWTETILDAAVQLPAPPPAPKPPVETILEDDEMPQSVSINGNIYALGTEYVKHYSTMQEVDVTRNVMTVTNELHNLNNSYGQNALKEFVNLLNGLGIPQNVFDDGGKVLNPETGKHEYGAVWSRSREASAKATKILALLEAPGKA